METKTLSLVKGNEQFCFRYEVGQEAKVLDALVEMVQRRECGFNWFDAAVISHQLGQHLAHELKACLPSKGKARERTGKEWQFTPCFFI